MKLRHYKPDPVALLAIGQQVWSRKWKVLDYTPLIMSKRPSATLL
jgi:hypothetical protein